MLLFWMEWVQNTKENPCLSLWDQGSQRHSTGVICLIHQSKVITYFNLGKIQKSSDTPEKPVAREIYDSPALSAWSFFIPQSLSPRDAINQVPPSGWSLRHWPILNPFYLVEGKIPKTNKNRTTKYVRCRSKDGTNTCFDHLSPTAQLHGEHSMTAQKSVVVFQV